jgi:transcription elongation factor GreA
MVTLADTFEDGTLDEGFPNPFQRAQALLNLATHLQANRRGNPHLTRVCTRLTDLLAKGKEPLLKRLMQGADAAALRSVNTTVQRGVESEIDHMVTEIALDYDRHFFAGQSGSFWETDSILTTKKGLVRRSAELRELTEVKIPANQDAIGVAASYGDLSENSEWEAAMEEQRNLTSRAMSMEEELRNTGLIEEAAMPEDTACPGSIVNYRETESGEEHRIILLGPWDEDTWDGVQVVSYRAPLAQGLMGLHSGSTSVLDLPAGELAVEVLSIEVPELEG